MSNNMVFLWAVTVVVWVGTLGFIASLLRKQSRLVKQLEQVEQLVRQMEQS